jgi:hypothetical protein
MTNNDMTYQVWLEHSWICLLSIAALIFYYRGSYRFYHNISGYRTWLGLGVLADILMAFIASTKILPVLLPGEGIPYSSILFILHIAMSTIGMVGYIIVFLILVIRGVNKQYPMLKILTYRILLPIWIVGVSIALINFLTKILFHINVFNFL